MNLARRNQALLDRQIEFIDQLEANEEDPDQLENLFKLDHLATRMRRNAESLLVLAGAEPPAAGPSGRARRRGPGRPSARSRTSPGSTCWPSTRCHRGRRNAVDLAHLLSELMENATQFSPPDTMSRSSGTTRGTATSSRSPTRASA